MLDDLGSEPLALGLVIDSEFHCIQILKCSEAFVQVILKDSCSFQWKWVSVSNGKYTKSVIVVNWTFLVNVSFPDYYFWFGLFLDVFNIASEELVSGQAFELSWT